MRRLETQRQFVQYHQRVLELDPIAYWPLNEKQGTVAYDWVTARDDGARNGTHAGVTLGEPGIGDGRTTPFYDGANDSTDILTASLIAKYTGAAGTIIAPVKVANAGVWADATARQNFHLFADGANFVYFRKPIAANSIQWRITAGGVGPVITHAGMTTLDWFMMGLSWTGGVATAYYDGIQEGAPVAIGAWVGALAVACIGAYRSLPVANVWHGWEGHVALMDYALPPDAHRYLYDAFRSH